MNVKKITLNKKVSRYVRRDSLKNNSSSVQLNIKPNTIKSININNNNNNIHHNKNYSSVSSYVIRSEVVKRKINDKKTFNKSYSNVNISHNVNTRGNYSFRHLPSAPIPNKIKIIQPRTPLINSSIKKISKIKDISFDNIKNLKTPKISINDNDYIKINNLIYYIKCPYCNHQLNQNPKKDNNHFTKYSSENKENISLNFNNINNKYRTEKKYSTKNVLKEKKSEFKNFFINEKGVIVFKNDDQPITSIQVVNSKPDLSKYSKDLKIFGKKRNISIYEAPTPETKVFVRPIKI